MPHSRRSRWILTGSAACLCSLVLLSGCAQLAIIGLIVGGPPHIEPEFDRETRDSFVGTDAKVAVCCYVDPKLKLQYSKIDSEVATYVTRLMQENRIDAVDPDLVHAWIDEHPNWVTADEIGAALEADYVVEIEMTEFDLYEPHSTTLFRGRTSAQINVHHLEDGGGSQVVFTRDVNFMYPTKVPRPAYDQTEIDFKREFLSRLGEEIGFMFYPSYNGDKIPWAT